MLFYLKKKLTFTSMLKHTPFLNYKLIFLLDIKIESKRFYDLPKIQDDIDLSYVAVDITKTNKRDATIFRVLKLVIYLPACFDSKDRNFVVMLIKKALEFGDSFHQIIIVGDFNVQINFYFDKKPCLYFRNKSNFDNSRWFYEMFLNEPNLFAHIHFSTKPDNRAVANISNEYDGSVDNDLPIIAYDYFPNELNFKHLQRFNENTGEKILNPDLNQRKSDHFKKNILVKKHLTGFLDNVITNKFNGIKNIIVTEGIEGSLVEHKMICYEICKDENNKNSNYEKDPEEIKKIYISLFENKKYDYKIAKNHRYQNALDNFKYENRFMFKSYANSVEGFNLNSKKIKMNQDFVNATLTWSTLGGISDARTILVNQYFHSSREAVIQNKHVNQFFGFLSCLRCETLGQKITIFFNNNFYVDNLLRKVLSHYKKEHNDGHIIKYVDNNNQRRIWHQGCNNKGCVECRTPDDERKPILTHRQIVENWKKNRDEKKQKSLNKMLEFKKIHSW